LYSSYGESYIGDFGIGPRTILLESCLRRYFPILILTLLFADLASLIWVGGRLGVLPIFAALILDVFIGRALVRKSGTTILNALNSPTPDKSMASGGALRGMLFAFAGLLFIIPGFLSDFLALILILGSTSKRLANSFETFMYGKFGYREGRTGRGDIIDVEAVEIEETPKLKSNSPPED
jgi:UPF0716 family protein affecting phage T7 exclusion